MSTPQTTELFLVNPKTNPVRWYWGRRPRYGGRVVVPSTIPQWTDRRNGLPASGQYDWLRYATRRNRADS